MKNKTMGMILTLTAIFLGIGFAAPTADAALRSGESVCSKLYIVRQLDAGRSIPHRLDRDLGRYVCGSVRDANVATDTEDDVDWPVYPFIGGIGGRR